MHRFTSFAIRVALAGALAVALGGRASAQTQVEIAAKLNEEGKELMYADKFAEAAKKFQEAVARVPEAKYFVNLCAARLQTGELDLALTACNAVDRNTPTPDQKSRAEKLIVKINEEAKQQHLELHPGGGGGGDPGNPNRSGPGPSTSTGPSTGPGPGTGPSTPTGPGNPPGGSQAPLYAPAVGKPMQTNLMVNKPPDHQYTWTLGFDVFGGGGRFGEADAYGTVMGGYRLKADYMLAPRYRLGAQLYFQNSYFAVGMDDAVDADLLTVGDLGVAAYKHVCLLGTPRLCLTPLAGVHVSAIGPGENPTFDYLALGFRLEGALDVAFGSRYEHVFSLMVGSNMYLRPTNGDSTTADDVVMAGLDTPFSAIGYLAIGYTYRFSTPIGRRALIILE